MAPWAGDAEAAARAIEEFVGARPLEEGADTPLTANTFRCEGEYWTLAFAGRVCRLRDAKGLHHIAYLLQRPNEQVAVVELLQALEPGAPAGSARTDTRGAATAGGDAGPLLDAQAKSAYRRRIEDLRAELEEAERFNDSGRAVAARSEIELIGQQLSAAVGLGGRDRNAASTAERARLTVTKRIKDAIDRIRRGHPSLGEHLSDTIRTGLLCAYVPDADRPVRWLL
jgi:non-specific serine/threonine protein kinase